MTDQTPSPFETEGQTAIAPRRSLAAFLVVALVGIALGAAIMFVLLRRDVTSGSASPAPAHVGQSADDAPETSPPSEAAVYVSPRRQQLIGVRTAVVAEQPLDGTIRMPGMLAFDETRVAEVHTKVSGWIERASVDFVGKSVRRGEALFSVYSPDLVATQKEYLLALKASQQLGESRFAETRAGASSMLAAARERLRLWDVTDDQIAELERTGEPKKSLTVYSPFDGIVTERNAFPGKFITPEASAFKIADLSTIWAVAQVFENELASVRIGQPAEIEFSNAQGARPVRGRLSYIYPDIDPATRRGRVRIEFENPGFQFKPESYVTVLLRTGTGKVLAVPKEAVINTGDRRYAILALPDGYFEPRSIDVGSSVGDHLPVLTGLRAGDRVVVSAQFLIDSETNLQAALAGMSAPAEAPATTVAPPTQTEALKIDFRTQPDPPRTGENLFEVTVRDASGQPVADAQVEVVFSMPAMPSMGMPAMRNATMLPAVGGGVYRGPGQVLMAGRWQVSVIVKRGDQRIGGRQLAVIAQ